MDFTSYIHYLCLVIIVFSNYVSLQSPETKEEGSTEESDQKSSTEDTDDQTGPSVDLENTPATFHWQSGIVLFVIAPDYDSVISQRINSAMRIIERSSCVKFKDLQEQPPPGQESEFIWLSIENPDGVRECSHTTMREEGTKSISKAILVIGYDCMRRRDILHALLHALGFRDEVTHPQRDMYIRVMWTNIQPKYRSLFWMRMGDTPHKTVEYDSMSIMHFHDRAFSVNGAPTIMPLVSGLVISPSDTLSQIDVMKLRLAFGHECNKRKVGKLLQTCQNALKDPEDEDGEDKYSDERNEGDYGEYSETQYEGEEDSYEYQELHEVAQSTDDK